MNNLDREYATAQEYLKNYEQKMGFANRVGKKPVVNQSGLGNIPVISKEPTLLEDEMARVQAERADPYRTHGLGISKGFGDAIGSFINTLFK